MSKLLITGAAGFIGTNLALGLREAFELILIDDFSREGSQGNHQILQTKGLIVDKIDVSDEFTLTNYLNSKGDFDYVVHLAAQTSLLESYSDPKRDFNVNAIGSLNLLEYLRVRNPSCTGVFMSSNKIYGNLKQFQFLENHTRFYPADLLMSFNESLPILPVGGYSISKAISDFYVIEYGKRYSMPVISLRQSAVYGPYQNARSDQGWVSFFTNEHLKGHKIQLRGNGKQVRDILHVEDFVRLILFLLLKELPCGEVFNVGGGTSNSLSILELFENLTRLTNNQVKYELGQLSVEDQKYFVSDNSKITNFVGWVPSIDPIEGIDRIIA